MEIRGRKGYMNISFQHGIHIPASDNGTESLGPQTLRRKHHDITSGNQRVITRATGGPQ